MRLAIITENSANLIRVQLPQLQNYFVGRNDSTIQISDGYCSRRHCVLYRKHKNELWIRDLNSRNGTFVNGERIVASQRLASGDEVRVGRTLVRVTWEDADVRPQERTVTASAVESSLTTLRLLSDL